MYIDTRPHVMAVVDNLAAVYGALRIEPLVRLDLSGLNLNDAAVVILALMNRGVRDLDAIIAYLDDHGAVFEVEEVQYILSKYETTFRFPNGAFNGLWRSGDGRRWKPNISAGY